MNELSQPTSPPILYVASRLPELSETFVYREVLGLRLHGRHVFAASVRSPRKAIDDPIMAALAEEAIVVYNLPAVGFLFVALALHPLIFLRAIGDAFHSDHYNVVSRLKHVFQAAMGITLAMRVRRLRIGHVHAHMAHVPATVALYTARTLGVQFSFTGHAADLFVQRAGLKFKLEQASFVACISVWHQKFYRSIAPIELDRLPVIRCSVALSDQPKPKRREIVTVARLVPKKGIDVLLRAYKSFNDPDWRLRIIGDGTERQALEKLVQELGVEHLVKFEGAKAHSSCLSAIATAGMFILPCRTAMNGDQDGIPVVLMEAMAASCPVICGDLPAIRELVRHGETGLLISHNDCSALASAMQRLAKDDAYATTIGTQARHHIEAEFSDDINLARLCSAFDRARQGLTS